jgi:hypothetical protein
MVTCFPEDEDEDEDEDPDPPPDAALAELVALAEELLELELPQAASKAPHASRHDIANQARPLLNGTADLIIFTPLAMANVKRLRRQNARDDQLGVAPAAPHYLLQQE